MKHYTVNVSGNVVAQAEEAGYHAYTAGGVTAIEIEAGTKAEAAAIASEFGKVLYVFE